jgi:hypothetical protein
MGFQGLQTGLTAFGQYQQGQQAEATAEYNASLQRRQADRQRETMKTNVARQKDDKSRYMAGVNVSQAASGVLADTGTPVLMKAEIGNRLNERISDYTQQALSAEAYTRSQAEMTEFGGQQSAAASKIAMGGTILGGIGKMGSQYASGVKSGSIKYNPLGLYNG